MRLVVFRHSDAEVVVEEQTLPWHSERMGSGLDLLSWRKDHMALGKAHASYHNTHAEAAMAKQLWHKDSG